MKKSLIILVLFLFFSMPVKCLDSKDFSVSAENLYMITLGILNKLNYKIEELQSQSGYILFKSGEDEYLIMISANSANSSNIKIQKLKSSSPLSEIRETIYQNINADILDIPKRADE